jgi:endonuclease YncB( thermonuclease family)
MHDVSIELSRKVNTLAPTGSPTRRVMRSRMKTLAIVGNGSFLTACDTITITLTAASVLLAVFSTNAFAEQLAGPAYVRDADTISISPMAIRLYGVDAPKLYTRYGRLAAHFLCEFLHGQTVRCKQKVAFVGDPTLEICYTEVDGSSSNIAATVVFASHAWDCQAFSGGRCATAFLSYRTPSRALPWQIAPEHRK